MKCARGCRNWKSNDRLYCCHCALKYNVIACRQFKESEHYTDINK